MSFQYYLRGESPSDIFIATTSGSSPKPNYIDAMMATCGEMAKHGIAADWLLHHGDPHVDDGRNACVAKFLESGASKLLFIDDDVGWLADEFVKFIRHDRDVVAAIYPKKSEYPDYPVRTIPGVLQAESDGLLKVEAVSTGFLMISRKCIEAMVKDAVHFNRKDSGRTPLLFERGVVDGLRWSGDYFWSCKWTNMGGAVFIDPEMTLSHMGLKTWRGCIGDHWRKLNGIIDPYLDGAFRLLQKGIANEDVWAVLSVRSGNYPWCAPEAMMARCYEMAKATEGPILEIGSGLTTIIMGMAASCEVHALEHDMKWLKEARGRIKRYGLDNVHLHYAPLREWGDGTVWHEIPEGLPQRVGLFVCDGPPRSYADRKALWRTGLATAIKEADWVVDDVDGQAEFYEQGGRRAEIIDRFAVIRNASASMSEAA